MFTFFDFLSHGTFTLFNVYNTFHDLIKNNQLKLNTGAYQVVKSAAHQYYTNENQAHTCTITPVFDRKGNQIETKYKVLNGKTSLYTFNLYHTRCSCLINGKNENHFLENDFPKIIEIVERKLAEKKITMTDFIENVKNTLHNVKSHRSQNEHEKSRGDSSHNSIFLSDSPFVLTPKSMNDSYTCSTPKSKKDITDSEMMNTIRSELSNVLSLLREHVTESERHMSILRDEIFSIKSHVSLHSKSVSQRVETVDNKTKIMENNILNSMQSI